MAEPVTVTVTQTETGRKKETETGFISARQERFRLAYNMCDVDVLMEWMSDSVRYLDNSIHYFISLARLFGGGVTSLLSLFLILFLFYFICPRHAYLT
jgi:hypothetical protein